MVYTFSLGLKSKWSNRYDHVEGEVFYVNIP